MRKDRAHANDRARGIVTLSACGLAGVLVVTLAVGADTNIDPAQHETDAVQICSCAPDISEPTFYSEMTNVNVRMHEGMKIAASGDIDRDFVRMMIPHHQGAIDMAMLQLKYGHDERLRRLAQSIIVAQGQEIAYMRTFLASQSGETSFSHPIAHQ